MGQIEDKTGQEGLAKKAEGSDLGASDVDFSLPSAKPPAFQLSISELPVAQNSRNETSNNLSKGPVQCNFDVTGSSANVDLDKEEAAGGHTKERHVDIASTKDRATTESKTATKFNSKSDAEDVVQNAVNDKLAELKAMGVGAVEVLIVDNPYGGTGHRSSGAEITEDMTRAKVIVKKISANKCKIITAFPIV